MNRRIKLKDGRMLGYAEYGTATGWPVFYCHGLPASRLEAGLTDAAAARQKIRMICPDRPGYGLSDFKPDGRICDWPGDLIALADALGLDRFSVLGVSGGGPYALSCAWKIPQRVRAVGVVGGIGPVYEKWARCAMKWPARLGFNLARRAPWQLRVVYGDVTAKIMHRYPQLLRPHLTLSAPAADQRVLQRSEVNEPLFAAMREGLRNGAAGALRDFMLLSHDWGFKLEEISIPVYLWHGEADGVIPLSHARHFIKTIPNIHFQFFPQEGHFSLPINYTETILAQLMSS